MCIQTITSYACSHLSTTHKTTTPHCSATSICTFPSPLPVRNEKSSLLCAKCLAEKLERESNQMRELEHFARVSGGEAKVAGRTEKKAESEVKSVKVIAKGLENIGYVTEGLLKRPGKPKAGSTNSVLQEKEEITGAADEKGTEKEAMSAEDVGMDGGLAEGIPNPMGAHAEEPSALEQAQSEEADPLNFKSLSLNEPTHLPDAQPESEIEKPKSPEISESGRSLPGSPEPKSLQPKDIKAKDRTPERSKIARPTSTLTPKKSVKFSTPTKANDTEAAAKGKGKGRGSKPSV